MSDYRRSDRDNNSRWSAFLTALLTLAFGAALLFWPGITGELIITATAIVLILVGIVRILRYSIRRGPYSFSDWDLAIGILSFLAGLLLYLFRDIMLPMLFTLFGIVLFAGGIVKLQLSANARRFMASRWYIPLCLAVVSCTLGVLIIMHPGVIADIITRFTGAAIVVETLIDIISFLQYQGILKRIV